MDPARTQSVALLGVQGRMVEVEAHIASTVPGFSLVGLPDAALNEARDRVRAAIDNSGEHWPPRRIIVGLSPAALPKSGAHFDLAIALCILAVSGVVPRQELERSVLLGELGLDGRLRPIRGTLPSALAAREAGCTRLLLPEPNAAEARLIDRLEVVGLRSLRHAIAVLRGTPEECPEPDLPPDHPSDRTEPLGRSVDALARRLSELDLCDVLGQREARWALEVAAAGGHHLSLSGPPGAGKTMLAERLPGLLPDLSRAEALEVTAIHSVAGTLSTDGELITRPPFADPHHSATPQAVLGSGSGKGVRPGAVSLAHCGVLFLDEAAEWSPALLDGLRQPLEDGTILVSRAIGEVRFPARFQLVLAANPCPCGQGYGSGLHCTCSPQARRRYATRVSGPLKDRIDISVRVAPVSRADLAADSPRGQSTAEVAERVAAARARQADRYAQLGWRLNAHVPGYLMRRNWPAEPGAMPALESRSASVRLTARGSDRVLKLAWTIADLAGRERPGSDDVFAALTLRQGDSAVGG